MVAVTPELGLLIPANLVSSCLSGFSFLWSGCFVQLRPAPARSMRATMQANSKQILFATDGVPFTHASLF